MFRGMIKDEMCNLFRSDHYGMMFFNVMVTTILMTTMRASCEGATTAFRFVKLRQDWVVAASQNGTRVRSLLQCTGVCSTITSCHGFNYGDDGQTEKLCETLMGADLSANQGSIFTGFRVYVHEMYKDIYASAPVTLDWQSANKGYSRQLRFCVNVTTSTTASVSTPTVSTTATEPPTITTTTTTPTTTAITTPPTTTTIQSVGIPSVDAAACLSNKMLLFSGNTVYEYSSYADLATGPQTTTSISALFTNNMGNILAAYSDSTNIYIITDSVVNTYAVETLLHVQTQGWVDHFGVDVGISINATILRSSGSVYVFADSNSVQVISSGSLSDSFFLDNNGIQNHYKSDNSNNKPDFISAACSISDDLELFFSGTDYKFFNFSNRLWEDPP